MVGLLLGGAVDVVGRVVWVCGNVQLRDDVEVDDSRAGIDADYLQSVSRNV